MNMNQISGNVIRCAVRSVMRLAFCGALAFALVNYSDPNASAIDRSKMTKKELDEFKKKDAEKVQKMVEKAGTVEFDSKEVDATSIHTRLQHGELYVYFCLVKNASAEGVETLKKAQSSPFFNLKINGVAFPTYVYAGPYVGGHYLGSKGGIGHANPRSIGIRFKNQQDGMKAVKLLKGEKVN